mmetsp:Transcript_7021/g.15504  ORF Transcript_7021/g.15504 Transcript_7021/m.15504 type:complete len:208 (+) Transcript_7021:1563-2186(+)
MRPRVSQDVERPPHEGVVERLVHFVPVREPSQGAVGRGVRRGDDGRSSVRGGGHGHHGRVRLRGGGADAEEELEELIQTFVRPFLAGGELFHHPKGRVGAELSSSSSSRVGVLGSVVEGGVGAFGAASERARELPPDDRQAFQRVQKVVGVVHRRLSGVGYDVERRGGMAPRIAALLSVVVVAARGEALEVVVIEGFGLVVSQVEFV